MRLGRLSIRHFRNLGIQDLRFPPEGAAILGENAQGKSNLLEAIYYLETFRSFRGARDDQLLAFDEEVFRVVGTLDADRDEGREDAGGSGSAPEPPAPGIEAPGERPTEVAAAFQRRGRRKKVTVDGAEPERIGDAIGRLAAVIFSPSDVALVSEGPSERRRFLDIVLSLNAPGYLSALQRYRHVLSQRNATLREERPQALVRAWDDPLVRAGAAVMRERARWVGRWAGSFGGYYEEVSGGQGARMRYAPDVELGEVEVPAAAAGGSAAGSPVGDPDGDPDEDPVADALREALLASEERERRAGHTSVGPHRDELVLTVGGREGGLDLRDFGSGGQRRTAALALRLVEADTIRESRGREPLVLLDDLFAELDQGRSERILALLGREETGQVILTAPKEGDVRIRSDVLPRWRIRGGTVEA